MNNLRKKVLLYQGTKDKEVLTELYFYFIEYIQNMAKKVYSEYAEVDLNIKFIKVICNIKVDSYSNTQLKGAIITALNRKKIDLIRKEINNKKKKIVYIEEFKENIKDTNNEIELILLEDIFKNLASKQQLILKESFIKEEKDIEISEKLKITKQAVGQLKKRALVKLKEAYM